jgi:CheY-like chemotaxis protein
VTIKLLAVDDSSTMRKVLGITFAGDGFQITTCQNRAEALEAARTDAPAIALVDAYLAGDSGYELCAELRKTVPGLPVVILTSKQRGYDEAAAKAAGAIGNFDKPFDSQKLIDKVHSIVGEGAPAAVPEARAPQATLAGGLSAPSTGAVSIGRVNLTSAQVPSPASSSASASASSAARPAPQAAPRPLAPAPFASEAPPVKPAAAAPVAASAPAAAKSSAAQADFSAKLSGLGLSAEQVQGVLALSKDVIEQVVWEVVPALAETLIREEIRRLTADAK